jgi:hypothetical protein
MSEEVSDDDTHDAADDWGVPEQDDRAHDVHLEPVDHLGYDDLHLTDVPERGCHLDYGYRLRGDRDDYYPMDDYSLLGDHCFDLLPGDFPPMVCYLDFLDLCREPTPMMKDDFHHYYFCDLEPLFGELRASHILGLLLLF